MLRTSALRLYSRPSGILNQRDSPIRGRYRVNSIRWLFQTLFQGVDNIVDMLQTDGQSNQFGRQSRFPLRLLG